MNKNNSIVLVTGGFDPIHSGHISLFKSASKLGKKLIVGINSDEWLIRKKGSFFQPFNERKIIVENLKMVNKVVSWDFLHLSLRVQTPASHHPGFVRKP